MDFHPFLYLNKILGILDFKMPNSDNINYIKTEYKKINNLFLSGKYNLVIDKVKKLLKKNSKQIPFYNLLALSYREIGNLQMAKKVLTDALKINPNEQSVLVNLGSTYRILIEFEISEMYFKKVLSINPTNMHALVNYANLKRDINDYDGSIELYKKALKIDEQNNIILINLAGVYQIIGKFELSKQLLEKLLAKDENNALAHKMLSTIKNYEKKDEHQTKMVSIYQKNILNDFDKATLGYAISKSFEDQKNYKKSFEFFKEANDIQKKIHQKYSIQNEISLFSKIKKSFEVTDFEKYPQYQNNKELIFIVGLPRSGTTLVHQILASHSKIYGAGELVFLDQFMKNNIDNQSFISLFKNSSYADNQKIENFIKSYFLKINFIKSKENIILDKNPLNFQWIGFIKILFPKSKIVHCSRNLKDTALSIYKNAFDINSIIWSNDEDDLAKYISLYLDLMEFWNQKIPNFIYNIKYEKLVENKKDEIKKLINFCGLKWEDQCLNFNKKANPIKTVSITQARKPIYNSSINAYKNYDDLLDLMKNIDLIEKKKAL